MEVFEKASSSRVRLYGYSFLFLWTGIVQHLLAYDLDDTGFGKKSYNNLLAASQPLGAFVCAVFVYRSKAFEHITLQRIRQYAHLAVLDLGGSVCTQASIALIGSGIFTVIYSFVVVYIALTGWYFYEKRISKTRWISLCVISISVVVSAFGELGVGGSFLMHALGVGFALGAVLMYGSLYLLLNVEFGKDDAISPPAMCFLLSTLETVVNVIYICAVVLPQWQKWVVDPMRNVDRNNHKSDIYIAIVLTSLVVVDGLHQIGFFHSVSFGRVAAVTSGVNKAAQAVGLFIFSDIFFCGENESQCMNTFKVIGTIGVCLGVVAYALDDTISRFFDRRDHPDAHEYGRAHSVDVESLSPDSESDDNEKGAIFPILGTGQFREDEK